jgi:membrane-associated phospholipid phosphatase
MSSSSLLPRQSLLPHGKSDLVRQLLLFSGAYLAYQVVRGLVGTGSGYKPFGDATTIINFERALHVFVEPNVQAFAMRMRWLMDLADWSYLNAHYLVTPAALLFLYLRRNESFYFVRNMFLVAMAIALVGYATFPTAPPRLMPEWGFTDSISQFLHAPASIDDGPAKAFVNFYAAVPSMHVCMAVMIGWPMARLSRRPPAKIAWAIYPLWITFVVIATGNHYLTDVVLGILTAALAAATARRLAPIPGRNLWRPIPPLRV